jgi:hypothetical protein
LKSSEEQRTLNIEGASEKPAANLTVEQEAVSKPETALKSGNKLSTSNLPKSD